MQEACAWEAAHIRAQSVGRGTSFFSLTYTHRWHTRPRSPSPRINGRKLFVIDYIRYISKEHDTMEIII